MGGARKNAGRKLDPKPMVRISIGIECEKQFNEVAEAAALATYESRKRKTLVDVLQAANRLKLRNKVAGRPVREIDAELRSVLLKHIAPHATQRKMRGVYVGGGVAKTPDQMLDDGVMAIKKALPKDMQSAQGSFIRAVSIPLKRPKGSRELILQLVAAKFDVAPSVVDKCWNEYRLFLEGDATPYRRKAGTHGVKTPG